MQCGRSAKEKTGLTHPSCLKLSLSVSLASLLARSSHWSGATIGMSMRASSGTGLVYDTGTDEAVRRTRSRVTLASCGPRSLCSDQACTECHARSFAGYTGQTAQGRLKRDCWVVERNEKSPREVFRQSNAKFSFRCDVEACGHVFKSALTDIVGHESWCPLCATSKGNAAVSRCLKELRQIEPPAPRFRSRHDLPPHMSRGVFRIEVAF